MLRRDLLVAVASIAALGAAAAGGAGCEEVDADTELELAVNPASLELTVGQSANVAVTTKTLDTEEQRANVYLEASSQEPAIAIATGIEPGSFEVVAGTETTSQLSIACNGVGDTQIAVKATLSYEPRVIERSSYVLVSCTDPGGQGGAGGSQTVGPGGSGGGGGGGTECSLPAFTTTAGNITTTPEGCIEVGSETAVAQFDEAIGTEPVHITLDGTFTGAFGFAIFNVAGSAGPFEVSGGLGIGADAVNGTVYADILTTSEQTADDCPYTPQSAETDFELECDVDCGAETASCDAVFDGTGRCSVSGTDLGMCAGDRMGMRLNSVILRNVIVTPL
jgi:hypothetical protein